MYLATNTKFLFFKNLIRNLRKIYKILTMSKFKVSRNILQSQTHNSLLDKISSNKLNKRRGG